MHSIVINRSIAGGRPGGVGGSSSSSTRTTTIEKSTSYNTGSGMTPDQYHSVTTSGVETVKSSREEQKKDMQDLNDRFAHYIEKVRYLEAQNRKLGDDLGKLREKWGNETKAIKAQFQADLDEARRNLDDAEKEKARLEIRAASLEEQIEDLTILFTEASKLSIEYKDQIRAQTEQLSAYQTEIESLRKSIGNLEDDVEKDKKKIEVLTEALAKARMDLDEITLAHIDAENRRQTLEEEIEFLRSVHEQEMKELQTLAAGDVGSADKRDFWKNQLKNAIEEIRRMYEEKMESMKEELETHYAHKVQEFKTGSTRANIEQAKTKEESAKMRTDVQEMREKLGEMGTRNADLIRTLDALRREKEGGDLRHLEDENNGLRREISDCRMELEAILRQLQGIIDSKMGLELEIAAYRKLLESEESRIARKALMESNSFGGGSGGSGGSDFSSRALSDEQREREMRSSGEMRARTTFQRSAKGPLTISDCPPDGKFVRIENTGRKDESAEGWQLSRTVDGKTIPTMTLDKRFAVLKPGQKMTIWAKGQKPSSAPREDIECPIDSWGIGAQATTKLINAEGQDKATHEMKTVYNS